MKHASCLASLLLACSAAFAAAPAVPLYMDTHQPVEARIADLLPRLTLEEKVAMLGGDETGFNSRGVPRLGIPPIRMSDGPVGVRTGEATAFPASVNMAASWDIDLVHRFGVALGAETLAKGKNCILGPCVGIHRFPLNGRNFESYSEDPFLAARMVVNAIQGIQSQHVIATVKHFACNDQEWERNNYDVQVDERTLREIHLPAFEAAIREGKSLALMSAYNLVNGQHCSENRHLLTEVLKGDWGFQGVVISDWVSVYSAEQAANNGLDIEMPSPDWFGAKLLAAVKAGRVSPDVIDDKIRRHLRVRFEAGIFENPAPKPDESVIRSDAHRQLALEMAQKSIVLLKNDALLPLAPTIKSIALIGPSAKRARTGGGGSSSVAPWIKVSPLDGITAALGSKAKIEYAEGAAIEPFVPVPIPAECFRGPDGKTPGLRGDYFNNQDFAGEPVFTRIDPQINFYYENLGPDPRIGVDHFSIRWTGKLIPPITHNYQLAMGSDDGSRVYLDGKLVIDNWGMHGDGPVAREVSLEGGKAYDLRIDYFEGSGDAAIHFGWKDPYDHTPSPTIADAVALAKKSDVAVVCVGNTGFLESEGADVADFTLARGQDELVQAVVQANPHTVVVLYGGVPIRIEHWLKQTGAVIAALYPGQEGGTALAQILTGAVNPSGKLPFSYIQERSQSPSFVGYKDPGLKVNYAEGVFVGYRYYDSHQINPLFPFGYGLSYTSFAYDHLQVQKAGDHGATVRFTVTNTGKVPGDEVAQVYVAPRHSAVPRPPKELKGFARVRLAPGESRTVTVALDARAFEYFAPETKRWTLDAGTFDLLVGASSRDIRLKGPIEP